MMIGSMERRALLRGGLALGAAMPFLRPEALLAAPPAAFTLDMVHPELRPIAAAIMANADKMPEMSAQGLEAARRGMAYFDTTRLADVPFEQRIVKGTKGQPDVTVYVINVKREGRRAAILHTHGGGFIVGSAKASVLDMQKICKALDCVAVTVEYRLAPETTYAGSIEDNYAGLKWLHDNAAQLGVDPARIGLLGESAGGGHAALLALTARDRGEVPLAFQCLIYPMLDDRTGSSRTPPPFVGKLIWTAESNRFGWESFLGMAPGGAGVPVAAVPARVADLSGLPPAFIGVGSIDLFADEDTDYARRLNAAGVSTELIVVPGAFHGFDMIPGKTHIGSWFNEAKLNALRRGLSIA